MRTLILVALGGAVGAVGRHVAGQVATGVLGRSSTVGTLAVNVIGSFVLGALVTWAARTDAPPDLKFFLGTGLCGALTTFSTFSVETLQLVEQGHRAAALANVGANLVLGLGAAALGMALLAR